MIVSVLAAVADNDVIGRNNDLPWHLPKDLQWFKRLTTGHAIVMGRRTFESIGRPLPNRRTIVLSRSERFAPAGVETAPSLAAALELASDETEVFVVGGATVYAEALPRADRLYLTRVHADVTGDVTFPRLNVNEWSLVSQEEHDSDQNHAHPFTFQIYHRSK